jgi:hypothetical protein
LNRLLSQKKFAEDGELNTMVGRISDTARARHVDPLETTRIGGPDLLREGRSYFLTQVRGDGHGSLPALKLEGVEGERRSRSEAVSTRERELERKYPGLQFLPAGDKMGNKMDQSGEHELTNQPMRARAPRMSELDALDKALANSHPAYSDALGRTLKVGFTDDDPVQGLIGRQGPGAAYEECNASHPDYALLRIFPAGSLMPATQNDLSSSRRGEISAPRTQ